MPDELTADAGALVEPLAVAHHALERTPRGPGEPVLVPRGGSGGARGRVVGPSARRPRSRGQRPPGASARAGCERRSHPVDPADQDVADAFADIAGSAPRVVVECVGRPGVIQQAMEIAATDGQVTSVGACMVPDTFHPLVATSKELTLQFVVYYRHRDFTQTLAYLSSARLDPGPLVTGRVTLEELPARFDALMGRNLDCKVLIHP